jgi:hypothetical protein
MGGVATTTTCPHGLDRGSCLICSTLGLSGLPTGRPEVITSRPPRRRRHVSLLGGAVMALVVLVGVWVVIGLAWSLVRGAELILVGALCGYIGYRIGRFVGRHEVR